MKNLFSLLFLLAIFGSCANYNNGELVGVPGRKAYTEPDPYRHGIRTTRQFVNWPQRSGHFLRSKFRFQNGISRCLLDG
jgi:hypothetical protein